MLFQYQCQREGHLFYYLWGGKYPPGNHLIEHCPVCGSKRIKRTDRVYPELDEHADPEFLRLKAAFVEALGATDGN